MTSFFERLGNLGVLLLAAALLVGGLAGAAVVYHYDRLTSDTVATQHNDKIDKPDQKPAKKNKHGKQNPGQKQHQQDDQETD